MAKSVKVNFIYTLINSISGLLIPLITFPYVTRVIQPDGIGLVNFYNSIIGYVVLLTSLGIPTYGIREIARVRDNVYETNKTAEEILILNALTTIIGYIVIFVMVFTLPQIRTNLPIFILLSFSVVLNTIGCSWFFSGVEDFKYITVRGLIIRVLSVVFLFAFVKSKDDLLLYALYIVLASAANNVINIVRLRKYLLRMTVKYRELKPFRHLLPALKIFVFNLVTSFYIKLDTTMLGFMEKPAIVGFYSTSSQLVHMLLSIIFAMGQATLPRISSLFAKNEMDKISQLSNKAYRFILSTTIPMCAGIIVLAPSIIRIIAGEMFVPAISTIRILSVLLVAIGLSNLFGMQLLYPMGKIDIVIKSTIVGALVNFSLNLLLIPVLHHNGAALASVFAEFSVTITQIILAYKLIPFKVFSKSYLVYLVGTIMMSIVCYSITLLNINDIQSILIVPVIGLLTYGTFLKLNKEPITLEMVGIVKKKLKLGYDAP